jgi:hypothetical protein
MTPKKSGCPKLADAHRCVPKLTVGTLWASSNRSSFPARSPSVESRRQADFEMEDDPTWDNLADDELLVLQEMLGRPSRVVLVDSPNG